MCVLMVGHVKPEVGKARLPTVSSVVTWRRYAAQVRSAYSETHQKHDAPLSIFNQKSSSGSELTFHKTH